MRPVVNRPVSSVLWLEVDIMNAVETDITYHAWFSEKSAHKYGYVTFVDNNGNLVKYTEISREPEPSCRVDDAQYLGEFRYDLMRKSIDYSNTIRD